MTTTQGAQPKKQQLDLITNGLNNRVVPRVVDQRIRAELSKGVTWQQACRITLELIKFPERRGTTQKITKNELLATLPQGRYTVPASRVSGLSAAVRDQGLYLHVIVRRRAEHLYIERVRGDVGHFDKIPLSTEDALAIAYHLNTGRNYIDCASRFADLFNRCPGCGQRHAGDETFSKRCQRKFGVTAA